MRLGQYWRKRRKLFLPLLATREVLPVYDEVHRPDRRALDEVVFEVLGLTARGREVVYEALVELGWARLEKAGSV